MPRAREVTDFLYRRFTEVGVTGMLRGHSAQLAVLFVCEGFVVWTDGQSVWWLPEGIAGRRPVPASETLWRWACARYPAGSSARSRRDG